MFNSNAISAYKQNQTDAAVIAASRAGLVVMLYEGAAERARVAAACTANGDLAEKSVQTDKLLRIVHEGLQNYLDMSQPASAQLDELYNYVTLQALKASLTNDVGLYREIAGIFDELAVTWKQVDKLAAGA